MHVVSEIIAPIAFREGVTGCVRSRVISEGFDNNVM